MMLFLLILAVNDLSNGSVSWSLSTKPAVFGNDIDLHCTLDNAKSLNGSRRWNKGVNISLLVVNGEAGNDTKLSEKLDKAKRTSIITITSLDTIDVNVPYTCKHGIHTYKNVWNMTVENFEYYPDKGKASFNQKDDHVLFSMKFEKVFPVPNCKASYGVTFMKGSGIVVTTRGTYPISFVKRLLHNGQPTGDGVRKIYKGMISTAQFGTHGLIASLRSVTLYQENHDRKCKNGNIVSIGGNVHRMQVLLECCYLEMDQNITNLLNISSVPEDVFYKVEINLKYHQVSKECFHRPFELDCWFGTKTIKQRFETANGVCLEMTSALKTDEKPHVSEKDQTLGTVGQVVFGIVFLIYCVIFPITYAYIQYNGC